MRIRQYYSKWIRLIPHFLLLGWTAVSAQEGIQIKDNTVVFDFPKTVEFQFTAESQAEIETAVLKYGTNARSCQSGGSRQPVQIDAAKEVEAEWEWELQRSGSLPPGTFIWWQWEITDVDGNKHLTDRLEAEYIDDRHQWRTLSQDGVTVHWFSGNQRFGEFTLSNTLETIQRLSEKMGSPAPEKIDLWVYPTSADLRGALAITSEWAGAVAFPDYATMVISLEPGQNVWAEEVIAHELTHLVVGLTTFNCRGGYLPTWLSEGLAVFGEPEPDVDSIEDVKAALEEGRLPTLRSLADGFSAYGGGARQAYAQSGEVVRYLIEEYGTEYMGDLMVTVAEGMTIDRALEQVYGFDTDELDARWRQSQGFPATPTRQVDAEMANATPTLIPTIALGIPAFATATSTSTATSLPVTDTPRATSPPTETATVTKTAVPSATPPEEVALVTSPESVQKTTPEPEVKEGDNPSWIWWGGGLIIIVGISGYVISRKRKGA